MNNDELTPWEKYKKSQNGVMPWDMFDKEKYLKDLEIAQKRLDICNTCPKLIKITKQCKECGCFMVAKTKLTDAICPIGKW